MQQSQISHAKMIRVFGEEWLKGFYSGLFHTLKGNERYDGYYDDEGYPCPLHPNKDCRNGFYVWVALNIGANALISAKEYNEWLDYLS